MLPARPGTRGGDHDRPPVPTMLTDLRQSLRSLGRSPFLCTMALLTLALGIGINTAMFSILDATLLRGLPLAEEHRVLRLYLHGGDGLSWAEFNALRERQQSFASLATYEDGSFNLRAPGHDPERVAGTVIHAAGLQTLEAPLAFGRWFTPAEDEVGAAPVAVISHALWKRRFQANPGILGQQVRIEGEWATIIGVAAAEFRFPHSQDLWLPPRDRHQNEAPDDYSVSVFGRLKPGVTMEQARAELQALAPTLLPARPGAAPEFRVNVRTLSESYSQDSGVLWVMLGAVFFVLLIACVNVANLLLARAVVRSRELAVRSALGAARGQLVRLLLSDAALLAVAGGVLGLGLAWVCMWAFSEAVVGAKPPYWMRFTLDARSVLYTCGLAGLACLVAGLLPAWRLSRPDLNAVLSDGSRGATSGRVGRITRAMVVGQIALSCALLVLSALMIRSVLKMHTLPLGYEPRGAFSGRVGLPKQEYADTAAQRDFVQTLLTDLRNRPEVAAAAASTSQPNWTSNESVSIDGQPVAPGRKAPVAALREISPGYLAALAIPLQGGRDFSEADTAGAPGVALASQAFAERHWPGQSALGRRVKVGTESTARWVTVVGLVGNTVQGQFEKEVHPQLYLALAQALEQPRVTFVLRARPGLDESALAPVLRAALSRRNTELPVYFAVPLREMVAEAMFYRKLMAGLFSVFGAAAFLLAMIGLYGVMSYGVVQRRQELGVRLALGASARDLMRLVVRQGIAQLAFGLAAGLILAALGARLLSGNLYGVDASDFVSFLATTLALGLAGFLASYIPGRRAGRIDPIEALRGN